MIVYLRETTMSENKHQTFPTNVQASINSDGRIVLRENADGVGPGGKEDIIVLDDSETKAIFKLMRRIKEAAVFDDMPF